MTARFLRFAMLISLFSIGGTAFAALSAGGLCPSGLPVSGNNCYFVAANGSDSNNGTSETTPFLHAPGMSNCLTNCSQSLLKAGVGIIFRGGDTWHFGNSSATPYAGIWAGTCIGTQKTGLCLHDVLASSSSPVYYGVDKNWYSGSSWSRPIFNADNSLCNSGTIGTMPDGFTCSNGTDVTGNGQPTYVVSGCAYQISTANDFVDIGFSSYVYFDNFELLGLCQSDAGQLTGNDTFVDYGADQGPIYITNLYIHGDSHVQFAAANGSGGCTSSTVCMNLYAFNGRVTVGTVGDTVQNNVVDFSDSDPAGSGLCYPGTGFYNFSYNVVRYNSQCIPVAVHVMHDNLWEFYYENGHSNLWEDAETSPIAAIYNNVFRHLVGKLVIWPGPTGSGDSSYVFNNVFYDVSTSQYFDYGNLGVGTNSGRYFVFNNTFQSNGSTSTVIACAASGNLFNNTNNHFIDDVSAYPSSCTGMTNTSPILMSNSTATNDGYTSSQTYAYSPTAGASPTVQAGTNEYSGYCSTVLGSSDSLIQAAGTACRSDTTYAVSYNASNHTVSASTKTVVSRPTSGAWDVGAYQYSASRSQSVQPPTGLTVMVQ